MTMRPLGELMAVNDAMTLLLSSARPIEDTEWVSLEQSSGRVLARDVVSEVDVPPFPRAAMDGYALRSEDTAAASPAAPVALRCVEVVHAGQVAVQAVAGGLCIEVATGAPLPTGADAVLKVEDTTRAGNQVTLVGPVRTGQSVTRQGADMRGGERVLSAGALLNPSRVGALAAVGQRQVQVYRRPRVVLGSSGNEIVAPGQPLGPGQIYDINSFTLAALLTSVGCEVRTLPTVPDTVEALKDALQGALDADVIVISGGSSVGVRDLTIDAASDLGEVLFHGVAIKPGKPTMLARIRGVPLLGMPGYPTSCLSNGYIFLLPLVAKLGRRPLPVVSRQRAPLARSVTSEPNKLQVYTVRMVDGQVEPAFKESGVITSMSAADGYILIPADVTRVEAGTEVEVTLF